MTLTVYSTDHVAPDQRARLWEDAIAQTYFPLGLGFGNADRFEGALSRRTMDLLSVSRLKTSPLRYQRRSDHIRHSAHEEFLVTVPVASPVVFSQAGQEVRCPPGGFLIERGDEPYDFSYGQDNDLYVLKLPRQLLRERVRDPDRFCARVFACEGGIGGMFAGLLRSTHYENDASGNRAAPVLAGQLMDLLALVLDGQGAGVEQASSSVRAAHLRRVEAVIRHNLADPELTPQMIAGRCGISRRYLHDLFRDLDRTVLQTIREQRLLAARDRLRNSREASIAEVAYACGFKDQAMFSRAFRAQFGRTPSGYRADIESAAVANAIGPRPAGPIPG